MSLHWHSPSIWNKCLEVDFASWGLEHGIHWLVIDLETRWKSDHGGLFFEIIILNQKLEINFGDRRHWNREAGRYQTQEEAEQEAKDADDAEGRASHGVFS